MLIAEDEAVVARDLQHTLEDLGYRVVATVSSGEDAVVAAREASPDLVLMDIRLDGESDGVEAVRRLREQCDTAVIYLTAYSDSQTLARAAETHPYGYIVKPFTRADLRSAIEIARHKHIVDRQSAERERWFSTTLRSIGDAVVACDASRRVRFMNRAAEQLIGWSESEAVGQPLESLIRFASEDGSADLVRMLGEVLERRMLQTLPPDTRLIGRRDGEVRWVGDSAAPIVFGDNPLGAVIVMRDVTEERSLRRQLAIAERMTALGTLAAGVAHEVNNPLTFVLMNAELVSRSLAVWREEVAADPAAGPVPSPNLERAARAAHEVLDGATRIRRIVSDLGAFGRPSDDTRTPLDIRDSIEWALRVTAAQLRYRARVITRLGDVPPVSANEARLSQVFVNLLINAAQALPEVESEHNEVCVETRTDEAGRAVAAVRDTGRGMTSEELGRIFDPFFTTKESGEGTGLGLSICHAVIRSLGGEIRVDSEVGKGSLFEVVLPPAPGFVRRPASAKPMQVDPARILVVDDEPYMLKAIERVLGDKHEVVTAAGGEAALSVLEHDRAFDLILCDLMMPGVSGIDLHARLAERDPELSGRMAFMTGGGFTPRARRFLAGVPNRRITKPFRPAELVAFLGEALGERH